MGNSREHNLTPFFKMIVAKVISEKREIKCERCGDLSGLEFHHKVYRGATIDDLEILCSRCHRGCEEKISDMETVLRDGRRFCRVSGYEFEY